MHSQLPTNAVCKPHHASSPWGNERLGEEVSNVRKSPKSMLLGLPCARCKAYFAADLTVCPICGCAEKVSAAVMQRSLLRQHG